MGLDIDQEIRRALDRGARAGFSAAQRGRYAEGRVAMRLWFSAAEWAGLNRAFRRSGEPSMRAFIVGRLGLRGL